MPSLRCRLHQHHLDEVAIALSWLAVGLAYLTDPEILVRSPVGHTAGPTAPVMAEFLDVAAPPKP